MSDGDLRMSGGAPPQLPKEVNSCLPPSRGDPDVLLDYEMLTLGVLLIALPHLTGETGAEGSCKIFIAVTSVTRVSRDNLV